MEVVPVVIEKGQPLPEVLAQPNPGQRFEVWGPKILGIFQWPSVTEEEIRCFSSLVRGLSFFQMPWTEYGVLTIWLNAAGNTRLPLTSPIFKLQDLEVWGLNEDHTLDLALADFDEDNKIKALRSGLILPSGLVSSLLNYFFSAKAVRLEEVAAEYEVVGQRLQEHWASAQMWVFVPERGFVEMTQDNQAELQGVLGMTMIEFGI